MSQPQSDLLTQRYGRRDRRGRRVALVASAVVGVLGVAWVAWVAWFQGNPDIQSSLRSYAVVDQHRVTAEIAVRPSGPEVRASCLVRAFSEDHSVVGELNFRVSGRDGDSTRSLSLRTEREATSVEMIGCTTPDQPRPR